MYIERVQVEEGFLSGLNATFTPGLNVVIGARGTGKTSLIELIRFCLGASSNTAETSRRSKEHALSILGSGQVTVTLVYQGRRVLVTRTASDPQPRTSDAFPVPIVFSQTEIEAVGLEAAGRLRLLDSFIPARTEEPAEEQAIAEIRSLTTQVDTLRVQLDDLEKQAAQLPVVVAELQSVAEAERGLATTSEALNAKTQNLQQISQVISSVAGSSASVERAKQAMSTWYNSLKSAAEVPLGDESPSGSLVRYAAIVNDVRATIQQAMKQVAAMYHGLDAEAKELASKKIVSEDAARQLRQEVDAIQAGSGAIMRRGQELRERKATLESMTAFLATQRERLFALLAARNAALDRLEALRAQRFSNRSSAANMLNQNLGPNIRVSVTMNGQPAAFASALTEILRGSGLRYGDMATALSQQISPRALLEAVDSFDFELISEAAKISPDRASRLLSHLRTADLGALSTMSLEDDVTLQLLDGRDYKALGELSTGQRCTVVLPLLLAHRDRILVVDQPEDHIDNAFIADTLIKSLLSRDPNSQFIFSTHNPNIPVLGDADNVLHLGSDGRRGYVAASGVLNEPSIVGSITSVMEGGAAAFAKRAEFYGGMSLT